MRTDLPLKCLFIVVHFLFALPVFRHNLVETLLLRSVIPCIFLGLVSMELITFLHHLFLVMNRTSAYFVPQFSLYLCILSVGIGRVLCVEGAGTSGSCAESAIRHSGALLPGNVFGLLLQLDSLGLPGYLKGLLQYLNLAIGLSFGVVLGDVQCFLQQLYIRHLPLRLSTALPDNAFDLLALLVLLPLIPLPLIDLYFREACKLR